MIKLQTLLSNFFIIIFNCILYVIVAIGLPFAFFLSLFDYRSSKSDDILNQDLEYSLEFGIIIIVAFVVWWLIWS